jgi:peptidyl-prolyl cis-trans isomerase D
MAIIGTIRKHSALAVVIVGVAIAAFVIGDFGKGAGRGTNEIGAVNGEEIPYMDFSMQVEENLEYQRDRLGEEKITEKDAYEVRQSTWENLVRELVMSEEFEKLGIRVTAEELFELVQGQYPHRYILQYFTDPQTGQYNPQLVLNYLKNLNQMDADARSQWLNFEQAIKEDQVQQKFNQMVAKSYYVPQKQLETLHALNNKTAKIRYVSPSFYTIPDSTVVLTDEDYRSFYEENKMYFKNDEPMASLEYVSFEVKPSAQDRLHIREDVEQLYQDFLKANDPLAFANANSDDRVDTTYISNGSLPNFLDTLVQKTPIGSYIAPFQHKEAWYMAKVLGREARPDSMVGSQILISWAELGVSDSVTRTQAQASRMADSLLRVLRKNPDRFGAVAVLVSDYPTAKEDQGELPWFPDGNPNVSPFFEAGKNMKPDEVELLQTRLGYSLFKLTAKSEDQPKFKAAILQRNIEPSSQTYQDYYTQASTFAGKYKTPEAFDTGAVAEGVFKRSAPRVKEMDYTIQGLENARNVVRWSFSDQTNIGEVSHVFDLQGKYVVVLLKDRSPEGFQPLDKVRAQIEPNVKNRKKISMMAEKVAEAMKTQQDLQALATTFNTKVDTASLVFAGMNQNILGRENTVMGEIFGSQPSQLIGPLEGNFGLYVVFIDQIIDAPATDNYFSIERTEMQGWNNRVNNSLYESLKKQATIEDNRVLFY